MSFAPGQRPAKYKPRQVKQFKPFSEKPKPKNTLHEEPLDPKSPKASEYKAVIAAIAVWLANDANEGLTFDGDYYKAVGLRGDEGGKLTLSFKNLRAF